MLTAIFRAIQSTGATPSANAVIACVRRHRHAFRDADAKAHLSALGPWPGTVETVPAPLIVPVGTAIPVPALTGPRPRVRVRISKDLVKRDMDSNISGKLITDSLRSSAANEKVEDEPEWVRDLRIAADAIKHKSMREMTVDDRVVAGRYHAYRFGNCTKSESTNVKRGAMAAKAFAQMADAKRFRDMTLLGYADEATVYRRDVMKGAPFHDPFAIRTMLDPEPEPAGRR